MFTTIAKGKYVCAWNIFPSKKAYILLTPSMHLTANKLSTSYFKNVSTFSYTVESLT